MEAVKKILRGIFIVLSIIAMLIAVIAIYESYRDYIDGAKNSVGSRAEEKSDDGDSVQLLEVDYDDPFIPSVNEKDKYRMMMFGDLHADTPVVLIGKVDQVIQGNKLRVATGTLAASSIQELFLSEMQFIDRHVLINMSASPRALVGDYIGIKGRYVGTVEYKTVLGDIVKMPAINADYYETQSSLSALDNFFSGRISAQKQLREQQQNEKNQAQQQFEQLPKPKRSERNPEEVVTEHKGQSPATIESNDNSTNKQESVEVLPSESVPMAKRSDVESVMKQARGRLQSVYKRALDDDPAIQGDITIQLEISASGQVASVSVVASDLNNKELEERMLVIIRGMQFDGGNYEPWSGNYKFNFTSY